MSHETIYSIAIVAVIGVMTFGARAFPFLLFGRGGKPPDIVSYLGRALPPAVMALLIVYALRNSLFSAGAWVPGLAVAVTLAVYRLTRNSLAAMTLATALYMALTQWIYQ
jgi:branched-subunit amino acid transport protein AzlD